MELAERPRDTRHERYSRKCSTPRLWGDRRWNLLNCATARMYVSWVLGDKLRIVMSSIMRWRRGEIGLVIGGLLSVGVHERAILADRTPPTDDPTPIGTANGPKGIYGRRSLSKPPKPTILDLSYRPHHKRLPRQRFSATGRYGIRPARSFRLDTRELDHLAPLLGVIGDELAEVGGSAWKCSGTQLGEPRLHLGIGESRVDLLVELVDDLGRRGLRCADAEPETRFVARHELTHSRHVG